VALLRSVSNPDKIVQTGRMKPDLVQHHLCVLDGARQACRAADTPSPLGMPRAAIQC
jgi:hypothetical protein